MTPINRLNFQILAQTFTGLEAGNADTRTTLLKAIEAQDRLAGIILGLYIKLNDESKVA